MIGSKNFALLVITTITLSVIMFGCDIEPPASLEHGLTLLDEPEVSLGQQGELRQAHSATARYHALEQALADGYFEATPCFEDSVAGGQGFHYLNLALLDDDLDPTKPELLQYIPTEDGLKFVAVEYAVPAVGPIPSLFGQDFHPFPAPPDEPDLFVLHVWLLPEVPNPSGLFADWNPNLSCDGD